MSKRVTLACLQMSAGPSVTKNLATVERHLQTAPRMDLLVLPENFVQMPRHRSEQHIESERAGKAQQTLSTLAKQYQVSIVAGSLAIRTESANKPYARCIVFDRHGERIAHYDKLHLFDVETGHARHDRYRESDTYQAGKLNDSQTTPIVVKTSESTLQLGLTICYDLRFPELYRILASRGAQVICVPSAFTYETGRAHWATLLRARAIENQVYIAAAAQTGEHASGRKTWGHTMIIDPWGDIVAQRDLGEGLVFADIDLTKITSLRKRFPVHQHQRLMP